MTNPTPAERASRKRLVNVGEGIGVIAVIISALGLWNSWRGSDDRKPESSTIIEQKSAVPLALRGRVDDDGKILTISAVEPGHAIDSLTLTVAGKSPVTVASDGQLSASSIESAVPPATRQQRTGVVSVRIAARYVEAGEDRRGGGTYRLSYRWVSGGLFGDSSLRLTGLSRG